MKSSSGQSILFLENRHQTRTWEVAAAGLAGEGHRISWMVMNHGFAPRLPNVWTIPYPRKSDLEPAGDRFLPIRQSDRMRYAGSTFEHYAHYDRQIRRILEEVRPDIVFGESTQFYELIAIEAAKDLGIPYYVPTTSRYPSGRFLFQRYDTLEIVEGSGDTVTDAEVDAFLKRITGGEVVLDYMKVVTTSKTRRSKWRQIQDWTHKGMLYLGGEKYGSPHPATKLALDRKVRAALAEWDTISPGYQAALDDDSRLKLLFPMQLQPEANLDVWGRKYRDQSAVIDRLATAAGPQGSIFVKLNPKSKYEMNDSLLATARKHANVVALPSSLKMPQVFPRMDLVVTVTGTVAMESIFHGKPCATLIRSRNNDLSGCWFLEEPEQVADAIAALHAGRFVIQSQDDIAAFVRRLYAESYAGIIQDPFTLPESASPANAGRLVDSFTRFVRAVSHAPQEAGTSMAGSK
jgi:hypothetical protein